MPSDTYLRDPAHGGLIPTGRRIAAVLRGTFDRQRREAVAALNRGQLPVFDHWTEAMTPLVLAHWHAGVERRRGNWPG